MAGRLAKMDTSLDERQTAAECTIWSGLYCLYNWLVYPNKVQCVNGTTIAYMAGLKIIKKFTFSLSYIDRGMVI